MARSTYIYILFHLDGDVIGAFTVKHELETFIKVNPQPTGAKMRRYRDGYPGQFAETDV